jgi:hypothetical protein
MAVALQRAPDMVDRFDVVEVGEGIRGHAFWLGLDIVLDVGENGDLPITLVTATGRLVAPRRKRIGHRDLLGFL